MVGFGLEIVDFVYLFFYPNTFPRANLTTVSFLQYNVIGLQDIVHESEWEWETKAGYGQLTGANHFNDEK